MSTINKSLPSTSGQLNVILHGAFAFVQDKDKIRALIPAMDHHVFRAGSWLAETDLRGRGATYELKGVNSGNASFDPNRNLVVKSRSLPDSPSPHITLSFPTPKQIYSFRVADVPYKSFTNPDELEIDPSLLAKNPKPDQHVATLQVFSYDFADENKLFLTASNGDGHYWEPAFAGNSINLHIFSSEDHFTKRSNSEEDFNKCVELFGSPLRLDTRLVPSGIPSDMDQTLQVKEPETEGLAERNQRMARLGRLVTQGRDANLAWCGNDALDGDPEGCGGPIMDYGQH